MNSVHFPAGFTLERLRREHPRKQFQCGEPAVEEWLVARALQNQTKHLSVTKVLLDESHQIACYFTLATGQIDFAGLPIDLAKSLPRRQLPVAVLAWLGVSTQHQGKGLGRLLLAQALTDCHEAGKTFPFIAVILDCPGDAAKKFYKQWDFNELPGHPYKLFLSVQQLDAMMQK